MAQCDSLVRQAAAKGNAMGSDPAAALRLLTATLDAVEPITMCAPRNHGSYGLMYQSCLRINDRLKVALGCLQLSSEPPLPEGVTHWDDLALLNSPHKVCVKTGSRKAVHVFDVCSLPLGHALPCAVALVASNGAACIPYWTDLAVWKRGKSAQHCSKPVQTHHRSLCPPLPVPAHPVQLYHSLAPPCCWPSSCFPCCG